MINKTKMDTKLTDFEEKLNTMHKCLVEKDEHIVKLQDKVKQLESNQENVEKLQILMEKVSNLEALNIEKTQVTFRCEKCPFVSSSEKGVKTHLTRKHTIISATGYPRKCELCNKQFNNPNDFKKHMKSVKIVILWGSVLRQWMSIWGKHILIVLNVAFVKNLLKIWKTWLYTYTLTDVKDAI